MRCSETGESVAVAISGVLAKNSRMYLKFTIDGPLEDLVRSVWSEANADELIRDYENVYELIRFKPEA